MILTGKHLVDLANKSDLVRDYLGVPGWNNIVKITNNSVHRLVGFNENGDAIINAQFIGSRKYKDRLTTNQMIRLIEDGAFKHLGKRFGMEEYYDAIFTYKPTAAKFAFATTGDLKPDADPETSTVDGYAGVTGQDSAWTVIVNHVGTLAFDSAASGGYVQFVSSSTNNQFASNFRNAFLFDTSSIGAGATISSGYFKGYGSSKSDGLSATPTINIYASNPASDTAMAAGDYDSFGSTAFCDTAITYAGWSTAGYNQFNLNSSGIAAVAATGITKLGTLNPEYDVADSQPNWVSGSQSVISGYFADNGSNEPILNVTYSTGSTFKFATMMGVG